MPYAPKTHRPRHYTARPKRIDRRASSSQRGYDSRWTKLRAAYVAQHPLCEDCMAQGRTAPVDEVDHVIPITGIDDPLRLMWVNLRSRCRPCHRRKTARHDKAIRAEYEASGEVAAVVDRWVATWTKNDQYGRKTIR